MLFTGSSVLTRAPTLPLSRFILLKIVVALIRSTSSISCETSSWIALRSRLVSTPLADCTARKRTRCNTLCVSFRPPSAVWIREMASCEFATARPKPITCALKFSAMLNPAASSAARLIRYPEDSFSMDFPTARLLINRFLRALIAATFVLRVKLISILHDRLLRFPYPTERCLFEFAVGS